MNVEVNLRDTWLELFKALWRGARTIAVFCCAALLIAVAYLLLANKSYRAETLIIRSQTDSVPAALSQLGSLAGIVGAFSTGGSSAEPLAVLRSRGFIRSFIEAQDLEPVLLSETSRSYGLWHWANDEDEPLDVRDAVKLFEEEVLTVNEDPRSGLLTVSITWTDPVTAAEWANSFVQLLNTRMRERSLAESEQNIAYLKGELEKTTLVATQQAIGHLMEAELQRVMLAKGNEEFSFRVLDAAQPPKDHTWPRTIVVLSVALLLGGLTGSVLVVAVDHRRQH